MSNLQITNELQKRIKKGVSFVLVGTMLMTGGSIVQGKINNNRDNGRYHELYQEGGNITVSQGVNLYVDGLSFLPVDASGNETYPFIYQGTTYLPVRALANALGIDVNWDNKEKAVELTMKPVQVENKTTGRTVTPLKDVPVYANKGVKLLVDGEETILKNAAGGIVEPMIIDGTTYLPVRAIADLFGVSIIWNSEKKEEGTYSNIYIGKIYHNVSQELNDMMMEAINKAERLAPHLEPVSTASNKIVPLCTYAVEMRNEVYRWFREVESDELYASYEKLRDYVDDVIISLHDLSLNVSTKAYAKSIKGMFLSFPSDISNERMELSRPSIEYAVLCMQTTEDHYVELMEKSTEEEIRKHYEMVDQLYQEALAIHKLLVPTRTLEQK